MTSTAVTGAVAFVWLGMVLAISFVEAPLKFRAPGVSIPVGLGIGRVVFRALNRIEAALALVALAAIGFGAVPTAAVVLAGAALALLVGQITLIRPRLNRRSGAVLAGQDPAARRCTAHFYYVGFEIAKVAALFALGCAALAS